MELDANQTPPLQTVLSFTKVRLENDHGESFLADLRLTFRSFLPDEPLLALEEVAADIREGKPTFQIPRDSATEYHLRAPAVDSEGVATLQPFRAALRNGFAIDGRTISLHPLPAVDLEFARERQECSAWGLGLDLRDVAFSTCRIAASASGDSEGAVMAHVYPLEILGAEGRFLLFPGGNTTERQVAAALLEAQVGSQPVPRWVVHPDHCMTLPPIACRSFDEARLLFGSLSSMLLGTTGQNADPVNVLFPLASGRSKGRFYLLRGAAGSSNHFSTVPFRANGISLLPLFTDCWPRVLHLQHASFNLAAVTGWFHRGKITNPTDQGFLNLFVFLESLKAHWLSLRDKKALGKLKTSFRESINRTFDEILGKDVARIDPFVTFRNRIVHQGVSELPVHDLIREYHALYTLCASAYLSLIGWTGEWTALEASRGVTREATWSPPRLQDLIPV